MSHICQWKQEWEWWFFFVYDIISFINELNQDTNLTNVLVVLNDENWLFKNCYLVKIVQLCEIKMNKLLMLKSVNLNLFIQ